MGSLEHRAVACSAWSAARHPGSREGEGAEWGGHNAKQGAAEGKAAMT